MHLYLHVWWKHITLLIERWRNVQFVCVVCWVYYFTFSVQNEMNQDVYILYSVCNTANRKPSHRNIKNPSKLHHYKNTIYNNPPSSHIIYPHTLFLLHISMWKFKSECCAFFLHFLLLCLLLLYIYMLLPSSSSKHPNSSSQVKHDAWYLS